MTPIKLPAIKITEPYSPTPRANASAMPVRSAGTSCGAITRLSVMRRCAERHGGFFELDLKLRDHRLQRPHDKRKADEDQRDQDPKPCEGDLDAHRRERRSEPPVRRVKGRERDAGDGGRQSEGQVDGRVE